MAPREPGVNPCESGETPSRTWRESGVNMRDSARTAATRGRIGRVWVLSTVIRERQCSGDGSSLIVQEAKDAISPLAVAMSVGAGASDGAAAGAVEAALVGCRKAFPQ